MESQRLYTPSIKGYFIPIDSFGQVSFVLEDPRTGEKVGDIISADVVERLIQDLGIVINKKITMEDIK